MTDHEIEPSELQRIFNGSVLIVGRNESHQLLRTTTV